MSNLHHKYTTQDVTFYNPATKMKEGVYSYFIADMGKGNKPKQNAMFYYSAGTQEIKLTYLSNTALSKVRVKAETWNNEALSELFFVIFKDPARRTEAVISALQLIEFVKTGGRRINPFRR